MMLSVALVSYALLALVLLWCIDIFWWHRRMRLALLATDSINAAQWLQQLRFGGRDRLWLWLFVILLVMLIVYTIRTGLDFSIILVSATGLSGAVYLADRVLLHPVRQRLQHCLVTQRVMNAQLQAAVIQDSRLVEQAKSFFPVLLIVLVVRSFIIEPYQIPSGSMKPTLEVGDFIAVNRFAYGFRWQISNRVIVPINRPKRGEVIVFKPPHEPHKSYIKRVVAIAGDRIRYNAVSGQLILNGLPVQEQWLERRTAAVAQERHAVNLYDERLGKITHRIYRGDATDPALIRLPAFFGNQEYTVPQGKYFVMGDNRDNSNDARFWDGKLVDEQAISGKAMVIWMHWQQFPGLPSFSRAGRII